MSLAILLLLSSLLTAAGAANGSDDCVAKVDALSVDGRAAVDVAPPNGFVSTTDVRFTADTSFEGSACPDRLNHAPFLLAAWISTDIATLRDDFTYTVTYVDIDGDLPAAIYASLDGTLQRTMTPRDPADTDPRDGILFAATFGPQVVNNTLLPEATTGDHWASLHATDGIADAAPVTVQGPRIIVRVEGALLLPNPTNRLVIQPLANGPTLNPPSEVLPSAGRLAAGAPEGTYSALAPIDPLAAQLGASWAVGGVADFQLRNLGVLEGEPGRDNGFDLLGHARTDARAYTGAQSIDLAPGGQGTHDVTALGGVRAYPETTLYVAHVGFVRAWYSHSGEHASLLLRTVVEADTDADGNTDLCVQHEGPAPTGPAWTQLQIDQTSPVRVLIHGCSIDVTPADDQDGVTSLDDIQDKPEFALAKVLALRIEAVGTQPPAGHALLVDNLLLAKGFPNTVADIDICFYGDAEPGALESPLQPLECVSDIGPHAGVLPAGATAVSIWANQMLPVINSANFVPKRPYLEPALYGFSIRHERTAGPQPQLPAPAASGRITLLEDLDADGRPSPADTVLAASDVLPRPLTQSHDLFAQLDGADRVIPLLLVFDPGNGMAPAITAFAVQRFANDGPTATLAATTNEHPKRTVRFELGAADADEGQGVDAARLGGLAHWRLSFGDGTPDAIGAAPVPAQWEHDYRRHGDYTATLTIVDTQGASASASTTFHVGGHPRWSHDIE